MRIRAVDPITNDWKFGKGQLDYLTGNAAVAQDIKNRCLSFIGDCFFATNAGIDWFNLMGKGTQIQLNLAISAMILGTDNVTGISQYQTNLNPVTRAFRVQYQVQTAFSTTLFGEFSYDFQSL